MSKLSQKPLRGRWSRRPWSWAALLGAIVLCASALPVPAALAEEAAEPERPPTVTEATEGADGAAAPAESADTDDATADRAARTQARESFRWDDADRPMPPTQRRELPQEPQRGAIIPITGPIDNGLSEHVKRRSAEALADGATVIVYEFDTPGGALDAMMKITKTIEEVREQAMTVAWIPVEAISAGALIALCCDYIAMYGSARIGDAQPILMTAEGYVVGGEKVQSYMRSVVESMAERNGYPRALVQAMITQEIEVIEIEPKDERDWHLLAGSRFDSRFVLRHEFEGWRHAERFDVVRIVVHGARAARPADSSGVMGTTIERGELAIFTGTQARELGLAMPNVKSFVDLERTFRIGTTYGVVSTPYYGITWSVELVRWLQSLAPILIMIGLVGLYIELKTPGFGLGGIAAIVAFGLYFGSGMFIGLADSWHVLAFIIGVVLILLEIFVLTGFGIAGTAGIVLVFGSLLLAGQDFVWPESEYELGQFAVNLTSMLLAIIGAIIGMALVARLLPHTPVLNRLILRAETARHRPVPALAGAAAADAGASAAYDGEHPLTGSIGVTVTELRPAGKAKIGTDIFDVVTKGDWIEQNQRVVVAEVRGNVVIVKSVPPGAG